MGERDGTWRPPLARIDYEVITNLNRKLTSRVVRGNSITVRIKSSKIDHEGELRAVDEDGAKGEREFRNDTVSSRWVRAKACSKPS